MTPQALLADQSHTKPTRRELEVLEKLARGLTSKQIAHELNISLRTADAHRVHLLNKLGAHSTAVLVSRAVALGYLDGPAPELAAGSSRAKSMWSGR
jgi:DNA-binding NarL/FixJ family response regulator